jgi:antitoxin ParD1/3/4
MNVSLTPQLEKFVQKLVKSGEYQSASEVVREGLRELSLKREDIDRRRELLRREIEKGIASSNDGETLAGEPFMKKLLARAHARTKRSTLQKKR